MVQLVGRACVICNEKITSALAAEFCPSCGNSVHRACLQAFRPDDQLSPSQCGQCGGSLATVPVHAKSRRNASPNLAIAMGGIALLGFIGYLAWPLLAPSRSGTSTTPNSEATTPEPSVELPVVSIETTMGTIRARLFRDKAPRTVENFVDLVQRGFYDGIIFHRVIKDFMIQTGDPLGQGTGGRTDKGLPAKYLADEFHPELRHDRPGILSMANSGPNTGDTQFFITTVPTTWLDDKHAIFGEVIDGMDVVRKIEQVPTDSQDRPIQEVKMLHVRIEEP